MKVIDLPTELLADIPNPFNDWYSLIRTCRHFYKVCSGTKATFAPSQTTINGTSCMSPPPSIFLLGATRKVADWATENYANRERLHKAISRGVYGLWERQFGPGEGLLDLCMDVTRMSVVELRAIYRARKEVINPITRMVHRTGRVGSMDCHGVRQILCSFVYYCGLFHHSIDQAYGQLPTRVQPLEDCIRRGFIENCWGERLCWPRDELDMKKPNTLPSEVKLSKHQLMSRSDCFAFFSKVSTLLLGKPQPNSHPDDPRYVGLSDHEILLVRIMQHQGLDTLRMLLPGGVSAIKDVTKDIRTKVEMVPVQNISNTPRFDRKSLPLGWFSMALDCYCAYSD